MNKTRPGASQHGVLLVYFVYHGNVYSLVSATVAWNKNRTGKKNAPDFLEQFWNTPHKTKGNGIPRNVTDNHIKWEEMA